MSEACKSHRTTLSARSKIEGGSVMPRALAVLRFTTRSNVIGCWIGRSPSLPPLRTLIYILGRLTPDSIRLDSIREQGA